MPKKAKHPCHKNGCPKIIREGRYCDDHKISTKYPRKPDTRHSAWQRGYNAVWRKLRIAILTERKVCELCGKEPATVVHHIPDYVQGTSHYDYDYKALGAKCHNMITAKGKKRK